MRSLSRFGASPAALLLVLGAGGCRALPRPVPPDSSTSPLLTAAPEVGAAGAPGAQAGAEDSQRPVPEEGVEWVRLVSGEWLKGRIRSFDGETLELKSVVLKDLSLKTSDVAEVLTARPFTMLLADSVAVVGVVHVWESEVEIAGESGRYLVKRDDLIRMVPGQPRESNYWSGTIRLSASGSFGNTRQSNGSLSVATRRQTAATRLDLSLDTVIGTLNGQKNIENETFSGRHDIYLSSRFYVTPLGLSLYRDAFQNIALRSTPYTGVGYKLLDSSDLKWETDAGVGYRATRFESVAAGQDDTVRTGTLVLGTKWRRKVTKQVKLEFEYQAQLGLKDIRDTNQDASALLSMDFLWGLDLDLRATWKRAGNPEPDVDGITPQRDDARIELGLKWEF